MMSEAGPVVPQEPIVVPFLPLSHPQWLMTERFAYSELPPSWPFAALLACLVAKSAGLGLLVLQLLLWNGGVPNVVMLQRVTASPLQGHQISLSLLAS